MVRFSSSLTGAALGLAYTALSAYGGVIYDNGPLSVGGHDMTFNRDADDFDFATAAQITDVRFFGFSGNASIADAFTGTISWAIYSDAPGVFALSAPGNVLFSGASSSVAVSTTGLFTFSGSPVYQFDFSLTSPVVLPAGQFWLELHNGATMDARPAGIPGIAPSVAWVSVDQSSSNVAGDGTQGLVGTVPRVPSGADYAFQLLGPVATPEPKSFALTCSAIGALLALRRRVRRL